MIFDVKANFLPIGTNLSLVLSTGASVASNVYDELGSGSGTAPVAVIGNTTLYGNDAGIGVLRPLVVINVGTAFTTGNSATLNVEFQGAPDTGSAGGYLPGTWQTYAETGYLTAAQLTAQQTIRMDWPAAFPANAKPRYYRLLFQTLAATAFTAGTIAQALITMDRDDLSNLYAVNNYVVA